MLRLLHHPQLLLPRHLLPLLHLLDLEEIRRGAVVQLWFQGRRRGLDSIGIDWAVATSWLGSPIAAPPFVLFHILAGFIMLVYIIMPTAYWINLYDARTYQFFSSHLFEKSDKIYDLSRVLDEKIFSLNVVDYKNYNKIYMSILSSSSRAHSSYLIKSLRIYLKDYI
ncbi:hypothetical protein Cni_G29480 [Canna indica]|uniref:Uncharacterized protein n=1 Tax=Canna indica TaxID=4628 RepID=A0AAQ3L6Y5_9LILI|nr:hypothetical protein Cni_G29480 [Canna indica]